MGANQETPSAPPKQKTNHRGSSGSQIKTKTDRSEAEEGEPQQQQEWKQKQCIRPAIQPVHWRRAVPEDRQTHRGRVQRFADRCDGDEGLEDPWAERKYKCGCGYRCCRGTLKLRWPLVHAGLRAGDPIVFSM